MWFHMCMCGGYEWGDSYMGKALNTPDLQGLLGNGRFNHHSVFHSTLPSHVFLLNNVRLYHGELPHSAGLSVQWFLSRVFGGVQSGCEVYWWCYQSCYHPWPHLIQPEVCSCKCIGQSAHNCCHWIYIVRASLLMMGSTQRDSYGITTV